MTKNKKLILAVVTLIIFVFVSLFTVFIVALSNSDTTFSNACSPEMYEEFAGPNSYIDCPHSEGPLGLTSATAINIWVGFTIIVTLANIYLWRKEILGRYKAVRLNRKPKKPKTKQDKVMLTIATTVISFALLGIFITNANIINRFIGCTSEQAIAIYRDSNESQYIEDGVSLCYLDQYGDDYYFNYSSAVITPAIVIGYMGALYAIWHKK